MLGAQTSAVADIEAPLVLAKECPAVAAAVSAAMGPSRGPDGERARGPGLSLRVLVRRDPASQARSMPR